MWMVLPVAALAIFAAGGVYVVVRFHRFEFVRRIGEKSALLSWLVSLAPLAAAGLFAFINVTAMAVVFLHLVVFWALFELIGWIICKIRGKSSRRGTAGAAAIAFTVVYLAAGWFFAHHIFVTRYVIETQKPLEAESLRVVGVADAHLGITLNGDSFGELTDRINALEPDVVVLLGDFVDDDSARADMEAACRHLGEIDAAMGVYFIYGNHDDGYFGYRDFTSADLRENLEANGVTILEDETANIGGIQLTGRRDRSFRDRLTAPELTEKLDTSRFILMLDHQPNDYDAEAASGADLVLSGHTHGGHIFPAGQLGLLMGANDAVYGLTRRGSTDFVVTSGVSGWAIPFKTGTISELLVVDIVAVK